MTSRATAKSTGRLASVCEHGEKTGATSDTRNLTNRAFAIEAVPSAAVQWDSCDHAPQEPRNHFLKETHIAPIWVGALVLPSRTSTRSPRKNRRLRTILMARLGAAQAGPLTHRPTDQPTNKATQPTNPWTVGLNN